MKVSHIGYAVQSMSLAIQDFRMLGFQFEETIEDLQRNISITFGEKDGYIIELVSPLGQDSPVKDVLNRNGCTPYHICYETEDLNKDIAELRKQRFKVIVPPEEAVAFDKRKVVFLFNLNIGLIELVEK